jgi:branched-chain amino acid transport system permease protein
VTPGVEDVGKGLSRRGRWGILEILFWLVAAATVFVLPERHLILNEIAIIGLFAISLDLILGYAGIVSLGHAAFFGFGAYVAGLLAKNGWGDPLLGLGIAALAAAALGFVTSFLVLRGADLTRLMVTLGVALLLGEVANQASWLTGGADGLQGIVMGPVLGLFEFDIFGTTAYTYSLVVTFLLFVLARRIVVSPFGLSLRSIRDNPLRARAIGIPVNRRLIAIYIVSAAYAGVAGALLAQTTQFRLARRARLPSLGRRHARARHRGRRLSLWRPHRRRGLQGPAGCARRPDPPILAILDRPHPRSSSCWPGGSA